MKRAKKYLKISNYKRFKMKREKMVKKIFEFVKFSRN